MKSVVCAAALAALFSVVPLARAQTPPDAAAAPAPPEYPPNPQKKKWHQPVEAVSENAGVPAQSMFKLWHRQKDGQLLAELPPGYDSKKFFVALTVASGELFAGLQAGDTLVYFRPYDKRLALIQPQLQTRSTGDPESQSSVQRLFTDRVLLELPILTMGQMGTPVIDLGGMLVGNAFRFFGPSMQSQNPGLVKVKTARVFAQNVEVSFEVPLLGGQLKTLHFSISELPENTGYRPRVADQRVGYFTTSYSDLGRFQEDGTWTRYITRWKLEKRDPNLKVSQPKNPIVFYIEHTTPVRYRPWVKQGILAWNAAFEKVGIRDAIEVHQQDAMTQTHMNKDPEDVRYNFVRWLNNDVSTAIGPSRVNPMTGEILDADIILTDGWIRYYISEHVDVMPQLAMDGLSPETINWLDHHPTWDPRILFTPPAKRAAEIIRRQRSLAAGTASHPLDSDPTFLGDDQYDGLVGRHSQCNGMCMAAHGLAMDVSHWRMMHEMSLADGAETPPSTSELLDGMPEEFVGPLVAHLVSHEVGHTLGLRHNFKASGVYSLADINSEKLKAKPIAGSVMDYLPINMSSHEGKQGEHAMLGIGPYDMWAIEYGYTLSEDLKPILARVSEPELAFGTDEDTWGSDPLAKRYDFAADPLMYAESQMRLVKLNREKILDKYVKDGQSWSKARRGYETSLYMQMRSLSGMADWIGGAFIFRDKKGDQGARSPVDVVPVAAQRAALKFVIDNSFSDAAFGLTPDLLKHLSIDTWLDDGGSFFDETTWPVHERIMAIQGSVLTYLLNPTTLKLTLDNELRTPADVDMLTLPELLDAIQTAAWSELDQPPAGGATARKPWISSLRRNLQREHVQRLIDLTMPESGFGAVHKPIANLAMVRLRALKDKLEPIVANASALDPYSLGHLAETKLRIEKALDAQYVYNIRDGGGGGQTILILGADGQPKNPAGDQR